MKKTIQYHSNFKLTNDTIQLKHNNGTSTVNINHPFTILIKSIWLMCSEMLDNSEVARSRPVDIKKFVAVPKNPINILLLMLLELVVVAILLELLDESKLRFMLTERLNSVSSVQRK